jgi:hypothetical protein
MVVTKITIFFVKIVTEKNTEFKTEIKKKKYSATSKTSKN